MKMVFVLLLMVVGCSGDDECDDLEDQIMKVAERDTELLNYKGYDRTNNPCADPVPVTSSTDYRPACDELAKCRD